jgi:hypothetical protein
MTTRAERLKVLIVPLALALAASLLVLVGPLTNKALAQTTPSGTLDANTLPADCDWTGLNFPFPAAGSTLNLAQTFTAEHSGVISSAQVKIFKSADPPYGDVTMEIVTVDSSGSPTDNVLASTTLSESTISLGPYGTLVTGNFSSPASVVAGQKYALVLTATDGVYAWAFKDIWAPCDAPSQDVYPAGESMRNFHNGDGWQVYGPDFIFAIYVSDSSSPTYTFSGFFRPVDNPGVATNKAKAGSAIPVKFSLGGDQGLDIFATGTDNNNDTFTYPTSTAITCDSTDQLDAIEETVTAGGSSLQYDSSLDEYTYVWKTDKAWAGTCRQLVVKLDDGTYHRANFEFVK